MKLDGELKKIIFNTFAQFGSRAVSVLLSLLSVSLLTRYLGTDGYGNYTLVLTYLSFFSLFSDVGSNVTLVREFARQKTISLTTKATYLNWKLILLVFSTILTLIALPFFPYSNFLKVAILIGTIAIVVGNFISFGTSVLQSKLRLDLVAVIDLITKVVTVAAIIYFIYIKAGFYSIIWSIFLGNLIGLVATLYLIRDYIVLKIYIDRELSRKLFKIALPLGITSLLSLLYFKIDTLMLSVMKTSYDVGIYGLASNILENILMVWGLFMASVFPLLSRYHGTGDFAKYKDLLKKTLYILILMSVVIIVCGNVFDYLIMRILGGSKFFASMLPFKIFLFGIPFFFLNNVFYNTIVSFGKTKHLILPLIVSLIVNVMLNLYVIPRYGYVGASYTTVITEIIASITYIAILFTKFKKELNYLTIV